MGDRAMAEIRTEDGSLYFYTHWSGSRLPAIAQIALDKARPRKGDDSYAVKIILDSLIEQAGARDSEIGAGVMLKPHAEDSYNGDDPSVIIDIREWIVAVSGTHR